MCKYDLILVYIMYTQVCKGLEASYTQNKLTVIFFGGGITGLYFPLFAYLY